MYRTGDAVLEASMSRVQFTLVVDDLQKCFDDKKRLTRGFHCGNTGSSNASGFEFGVKFGGESEDCLSGHVWPLKAKTVFIHGLRVAVLDEKMKLINAVDGWMNLDVENSEVKSGTACGWKTLCSRSELKGAKGLHLQVDVIFGNERCTLPITKKRDVTLNEDMVRLFKFKEAADVTFSVGKERIKVHKHVLKMRSNYFLSMFDSGMEESKTNLIEIKDADPKAFKELIKFLYSGLLPENIDAIAMDLLPIADRYEVQELTDMCVTAIRRNLSVENVIESLVLAETYNCENLLNSCVPLFKKNLKDLRKSKKWKEMKKYPDLLSKLLSSFAD